MNRLLVQIRENSRLRVLLALVVFVVAFVKVLDLRDAVSEKRTEAQRAETEFRRWEAVAQESGWTERVGEMQKRRQAAEGWLWTGTTGPQAQLAVQEWLAGQMKGAKLNAVRVTGSVQPKGVANRTGEQVTGTQPLPSDIVPLRLGVSFELTPDSVERFAGLLDGSGKAFVIDSMTVRRQPLPRVEAELVTLARVVPRAEAKDEGKDKAKGAGMAAAATPAPGAAGEKK